MDAQVDRSQLIGAQLAQVHLDVGAQVVGLRGGDPVARLVAAGADLAHQRQLGRVRVQCLADEFVRDVGAVELCGVDVVDAKFDGPPEDGDGLVVVARWAEDSGSGELHGAEADAIDRERAELECRHAFTQPRRGRIQSECAPFCCGVTDYSDSPRTP